jgi:SAM-dependent methyltransferase
MAQQARYDAVADFYEQFAPDAYEDPAMVALLRLIGNVVGLHVLDVACGHGRLSRELARRDAVVTGVDLSAALLSKARAIEHSRPLGVVYVHADAAAAPMLADASFDAVTCSFGLMDIDDLPGAVSTVARVLRPGGLFAFSLLHPCFPGWPAKGANPSWLPGQGYYAEQLWYAEGPPHGIRPRVGANHRTLGTYLNTLARSGLLFEELAEPPPPDEWMAVAPSDGPVPTYLVARCRRMR